jgi:hypothetical protein
MNANRYEVRLVNGDAIDVSAASKAAAIAKVNRDAERDGLNIGYRAVVATLAIDDAELPQAARGMWA